MNDTFFEDVAKTIATHGFQVIGVFDPSGDGPSFSYTIGLSGGGDAEVIVIGLPPRMAHEILSMIHAKYHKAGVELPVDVKVAELANLPVIFRECDQSKSNVYHTGATHYYGGDVKVVQMVIPDAEGKFPEDAEYDHAYMDIRQPLLYTRKNLHWNQWV